MDIFLVKKNKRGLQVEYLSTDRRIDGYRSFLVKKNKRGKQVEYLSSDRRIYIYMDAS